MPYKPNHGYRGCRERIVEVLADGEGKTLKDISSALPEYVYGYISKIMKSLVDDGKVNRIYLGVYQLPPKPKKRKIRIIRKKKTSDVVHMDEFRSRPKKK